MRLSSSRVQSFPPAIPFEDCPAKSWSGPSDQPGVHRGRTVEDHCLIVCAVAQELIARLPPVVAALFPPGAAFAAGCHDIGKVSPYFFEKIRRACTHGTEHLPILAGVDPKLEENWGGHAGISQVCAKAMGAPRWVPEILGAHHGKSPNVGSVSAEGGQAGGPEWQRERVRLVSSMEAKTQMTWPLVASQNQARLLSGLATVSDWIGSGAFFEDPRQPWKENIKAAVDSAGFVAPEYRPGLTFEQIFGFPARSPQRVLIENVSGPGVYLFEAGMGLGKTEAALYCAYQMLSSGQASGIYFALPTQLTSNKIQDRVGPFLDKILAPSCKHRSWLLHSSSWMLEAEQGEDARPGGEWFSQSKRGLLAPFAVGTVDQALMAAMRVKHGFVRAFGLAGKVVILDEVHTYDAYTGTLLGSLVAVLRELGCTVIILSATLDATRRQELLPGSGQAQDYPLVSTLPSDPDILPVQVGVPDVQPTRRVIIRTNSDDLSTEEAIARARAGQQVLWIENTVRQAQDRFSLLSARAPEIEIGLLHSRFTPIDRARLEDKWVGLFGRSGWNERTHGRILVGTQVLEQSLDLDADFLVSAFAPTDMLLQRLGRLWRHDDTHRAASASYPEAWLLAPPLTDALDDPLKSFGPSAYVYAPYTLCRTLQVWSQLQSVELPTDIRSLINQTYCPQSNPRLDKWHHDMMVGSPGRPGVNRLKLNAIQAISEYGNVTNDDEYATRFGERPSDAWLLLSSISVDTHGIAHLVFMDGSSIDIPVRRHLRSKQEWRQAAVIVARNIVSIPRSTHLPAVQRVSMLRPYGLHNVCYLGDLLVDGVSQVQVAIVDFCGNVQPLYASAPAGRYTSRLGYVPPPDPTQRQSAKKGK